MSNSVAVITGGSRGIGFGIATILSRKGFSIVIADVDPVAAERAVEMLEKDGGTATSTRCDVTSRVEVDALMKFVVDRFGSLDVLVNNAGICPFIDVMEVTPQVWQKTIDVNLSASFHCTQSAAKYMIAQGKGRVIFITSLAEEFSQPSQVDYGASKAGMKMTMVGFASALGKHGITCNAVAPGMILTDMTRHHWELPEPARYIKTRVPVGRIGTPEDIGKAVAFLASDEAAYISGITLRVDGGYCTMCP